MGHQLSRPIHPNLCSHELPDTAPFIGDVTTFGIESRPSELPLLFPLLAFSFLTFNFAASIRRSIHDPWTVAFVAASYADILLLYYCFCLVERTAPYDDRRRDRLKAAVWSLSSLLLAMFACRTASNMPFVLALIDWAMLVVFIAGSFYMLFMYKELPEKDAAATWKNHDACDKC